MFTFLSSKRSRRPMPLARPKGRPGPTVEDLEGRVLFAFNAYIAGLAGGATDSDASFVFSTTGQAAKQWVIDWADGSLPETHTDLNGFPSPQTWTHHYGFQRDDYHITASATSTTNVTVTAVPLAENSAFGNGGGTGKEVQGLSDSNSVGTNIASVVDADNNTYVLSIDGKRFAVTRFKPDGTIDSGTGGWTSSGTFVFGHFTSDTIQDTPKAMAIDNTNHYLYVAGTSNNTWAIGRLDLGTTPPSEGWKRTYFTGSANALWIDTSGETTAGDRLGVAGTTSSGQIAMSVLHSWDSPPDWSGGDLDTGFGGTGFASAPNTIYGITGPTGFLISASASAVLEGDDTGTGGEEWYVSGTVSYCQAYGGGVGGIVNGSDMVIVDFLETGSLKGSGWGNNNGATLFNTCNSCCLTGGVYDSNYAIVPSFVGGSAKLTLVGTNGSVLTERFNPFTGLRDTTYGPLKGSGPDHQSWAVGPTGTGFAAVRDPKVNEVVVSGTGGANDFLAVRFNNDGTLDTNFGSGGSIKIDFGSTTGITTDGARTIAMRTFDGGTTYDILVGGYTFNASTGKYMIALVDLLDDNTFLVE